MKSRLTGLMLVLLAGVAHAQIEEGQGLLTGSISGSFDRHRFEGSTLKSNSSQSSALVSYGSFIRPGLLLGAEASFDLNRQRARQPTAADVVLKANSYAVSVTPFARYYWQYNKLLLYAGGGLTLAGSGYNSESTGDPFRTHTKTVEASLEGQAGAIYPLSGRIGLEVYARSGVLPVSLNTTGIGLVLFTGSRSPSYQPELQRDSPQLNQGGLALTAGFSTTRTRQTATYPQYDMDKTLLATTASVSVGYFIRDRTQPGIRGNYTFGESAPLNLIGGYVSTESANFFSVNPYIRHYLSAGALTPYVEGGLLAEFIRAGGPTSKGYGARLSAGLAYLLGRRFIVEAELGGIQGSYSKGVGLNTPIASIYGPDRLRVALNATLRPNFALSYVFR